MPSSSSSKSALPSPIMSAQKPINIFYVWYSELCRRLNCTPTPAVKPAKPKCQTVLDFVADRLKPEEWNPVINALRHDTSLHVISIRSKVDKCPFLHDVDTEQKVRQMKRRCGVLWTAFILKSLTKSLSYTVKNNEVLTCLEFDGIPMFIQYLEPLLKALRNNSTLKSLSLSRCKIGDVGCQLVCAYMKFTPNIEVLNLSGCDLTAGSGDYLAKLIKYQQINRYCEVWHNSLRYSDPNVHTMRGIKRITLNANPYFGDDGLELILAEFYDDLWIKALDMQKCGITDNMARKIIDVVEFNQSLEIIDFRLNDELNITTIEKILSILKQRQPVQNNKSEFQWCNTTLSLTCNSVMDTMSNYTPVKNTLTVQKVKSTPLKQLNSKLTNLRKTKTTECVPNKSNSLNFDDAQRKVLELKNQLQEEILKRKETEKLNEQLKRKLEEICSTTVGHNEEGKLPTTCVKTKQKSVKKKDNENKIDFINIFKKVCNNGFKKSANGFTNNGENGEAVTVFKQFINQNCTEDGTNNDIETEKSSEEDLFYLKAKNGLLKDEKKMFNNSVELSESQVSLLNFMESLKNDKNVPTKNGFCKIVKNK